MHVGSANSEVIQSVALFSVKSAMKQQESQVAILMHSLQQLQQESVPQPSLEQAPRIIDLLA